MYDETLTWPSSYQSISVIAEFFNKDGFNSPRETIDTNCECVKQETLRLIASEIVRIKNDTNLSHLFKE